MKKSQEKCIKGYYSNYTKHILHYAIYKANKNALQTLLGEISAERNFGGISRIHLKIAKKCTVKNIFWS